MDGCANLEVYGPSSGTPPKVDQLLKGIPFYIKVPVLTQVTKLVSSELVVGIDLSLVDAAGPFKAAHYPASGPLRIQDDPVVRKSVDDLMSQLLKKTASTRMSFEAASDEVSASLNRVKGLKQNFDNPTLLSNIWSLSMVVGPQPHYITGKIPFIGSATSNFEFSADGTLTKASSTVTDDTAKTLLSLFPITAKLSDQWGLPKDAAKTTSNVKPEPAYDVRIEITIVNVQTIYTLARIKEVPTGTAVASYLGQAAGDPPLILQEALAGKNGVQLISKEVVGARNDAGGVKSDSKAYQFEGTITPPKPDAPKPGNTDPSKGPVTQ